MKHLLLYTSVGCHLCDQAIELIEATLDLNSVQVELVEISDSDELVETYGIRIPVLRDPNAGLELGWPFGREQLLQFLGGC